MLRSLLGTARRFYRGLPYFAKATRFGWHYPLERHTYPDRATQSSLEVYFDGVDEGPGIWKWRHYFDIYHRHFQRFVGHEVHVVEIGIYSGGSLPMWRSYLGGRSHITGVDIEPACRVYESDHVSIHIGDQADRGFWRRFRNESKPVDILIDDGGHRPEQQQITLEELLPHIQPGGVYFCEDIVGFHNPFWGYASGLAHLLSSSTPEPTALQSAVNSIHVYPFVTVIEKNEYSVPAFESTKRGTQWQPFGLR